MLNRIKKFFKSERGDAEVIEAAILYPLTFMVIFLLIYIGLYILQMMTVTAYAQKVALLAAREVSCPGYSTLFKDEANVYNTAAAEADFGDSNSYEGKINIDNKSSSVHARAYRYWGTCLTNEESEYYRIILEDLVKNNSIINAGQGKAVEATITPKNYFITQFVNVEVTQELIDFPVLTYFGIENPKVVGVATATVSDTDELVRNTDFAVDALSALANHLGIDTTKIKSTVVDCLNKLGLL